MTKMNNDSDAALQNAWTTGHAAAVTSPNQAGIEVHADKLVETTSHSKIAAHPFIVFGATRTGMSAGPVLSNVLDLASKRER